MAASPLDKSYSNELKILSELRSALHDGIRKCCEVAFCVTNEPLLKTIRSLEQQSSQYANELNSQIEALGGKPKEIKVLQASPFPHFAKKEKSNVENKASRICRKIESSVIYLYSKALNGRFENDSLKKMMQQQMNGIMCTTLQLKLLSKFLHNQ